MIALISILLLTASVFCERVELQSPRYTNYGDWHPWARCRDGEFAYGIQVKVEGDQRGGDDTGLNAVCLFCRPLGSDEISRENWINSGVGLWGEWGARKYCPNTNLLIGFELRSEPDQRGKDDVAADNFAGYCGEPLGPRTKDVWVAGDTPGWGKWTGAQLCPEKYAVCGIQSQIEGDQRGGDDTALNNVNVECCKITVKECKPRLSLEHIGHYDNSRSAATVAYEIQQTISITKTIGSTTTVSNSEKKTVSSSISSSMAFTDGQFNGIVTAELAASLEKMTTHELQTMTQEAITNERSVKTTFTIPAKASIVIEQLVITCGEYRIATAKTITRSV